MTESADADNSSSDLDLDALLPILRRVAGARLSSAADAEDVVQETVARVLAAADRIGPGMLEPYAIRVARNLVANSWRDGQRTRRIAHRLIDAETHPLPEDRVVARAQSSTLDSALAELPEGDRALLIAHDSDGESLTALAAREGTTAGALAARLHRIRARVRVHYLVADEVQAPPTERCLLVLTALSGRDRRRQRAADVEGHLLGCDYCARVARPLLDSDEGTEITIDVTADADIVRARQAARDLGSSLGLSRTDLTMLATAVSEVARNMVRFADGGRITVRAVTDPRLGVQVVARDAGPGIPDLDRAMTDGFSTYAGLGIGLAGARRLMDDFEISTVPGRGTMVAMTKWKPGGAP